MIHKKKKMPLPLQSGNLLTPSSELTYGPGSYHNLRDSGAQVRGAQLFIHGDDSGSRNTFRLEDCANMLFSGVDFSAMWRPTWAIHCKDSRWSGCHFHHARQECLILGGCTGCVIEDCIAEYAGPHYGPPGYSDPDHHEPSADHGFYISYGCQDCILRRSIARYVTGCALHLNWNADDGIIQHGFHGEDLIFISAGSEGTPAVQPDASEDCSLKNVAIAHSVVGAFTFYDDGNGKPCKNWTIEGMTLYNPKAHFNFHFAEGTENIEITNSLLWLTDNAPIFEGVNDDGVSRRVRYDEPKLSGNLIITDRASDLPESVKTGNTIWGSDRAATLLPGILSGNFTPTDPSVPGFRDWKSAG